MQTKTIEVQRKSPEKVKQRERMNELDMMLQSMKRESDWKVLFP